jgi:hypothetical protein
VPELVYVQIFRIFDRRNKEWQFFVCSSKFYTDI